MIDPFNKEDLDDVDHIALQRRKVNKTLDRLKKMSIIKVADDLNKKRSFN